MYNKTNFKILENGCVYTKIEFLEISYIQLRHLKDTKTQQLPGKYKRNG